MDPIYPKPKIYVAGASSDIDLIESWIAKLDYAGFAITFDWTKEVRKIGSANPRDASWDDRLKWSDQDRRGVLSAQVFWLLMPSAKPSIGCWVEYGMAVKSTFNRPRVYISGDIESTIFSAFADARFSSHENAFASIVTLVPGRSRDGGY